MLQLLELRSMDLTENPFFQQDRPAITYCEVEPKIPKRKTTVPDFGFAISLKLYLAKGHAATILPEKGEIESGLLHGMSPATVSDIWRNGPS